MNYFFKKIIGGSLRVKSKLIFWSIIILFAAVYTNAQAPDLVIQKGHTRGITKINFNNEGNRIITLGNDLATKVWDPFNGRLISDLQSTTGKNGSTYYSPDNKFVLTMSADNSFYLKYNFNFSDPISGKLFYSIKVNRREDFCISPEGKYFATKADDMGNKFKVFDSYTGKLIRSIKAYSTNDWPPVSINFTTDSTLIVGCLKFFPKDDNGKLFYTIYNILSNKVISSFDDFEGGNDLTFSNTGRYMVSQRGMPPDGDSRIFDLKENKIIWKKDFNLSNIVFSPDDRNFIATCTDVKGIIHKSPNPTVTIEFSTEDTSKYFIIPYINANHIHNIDYGKEAFHSYSPKGNFIAYGLKYEDNNDVSDMVVRIGIYNRKYELVSVCPTINRPITALTFSNDENYIVAGYDDGSFITWDIREREGKKVAETELIFDPINEVHIDKKSKRLFYLTDDFFYKIDEQNFSTKQYANFGHLPTSNFTILDNYSFLYLKKEYPPSTDLVIINNDNMSFKDYISTDRDFKEMELDNAAHSKLSLTSKTSLNAKGEPIFILDNSLQKKQFDSIQILSIIKPKSTKSFLLKSSKSVYDFFNFSYNKQEGYYVYLRIDDGIFLVDDKSFQFDKIEKRNEYLTKNRISNNGKYFFSNYSNGAKSGSSHNLEDSSFFYCYDIKSGKLVFRFLNDDPSCKDILGIENPIFSPDNTTFCIFNKIVNTIYLHETSSGKRVQSLEGHASSIKGVEYSDDSKFLYSWAEDGTCKKWNLKTGDLVYTLIQFKDHDFAYILPSGYYYISSRSDTKYLNFRWDNKLYSFGQFDLMFNRPDKVLQALGNKDSSLVNLYHKAWLERIKKTGFNESDFENTKQLQIPTTTLSLDSISTFTRDKNFQLSFSLRDSLFFLNGYTIYINDVPINGINGTKIAQHTNSISIVKQLELSEGQNKIEVSCINFKGVESRKEAVYVNYKPTIKATPKVYFIGIGINQYNNNPSFKDLNYCVKDIKDLTSEFSKKYNDISIDTLLNEKATKENILALKQKLMLTNIEDKVVISFSGHGMVDNTNNEFYFVTGKTNASDPSKEGVSYSDLEDLLDSIPARKKLMLLDACHSGESEEGVASNETISKEGGRGNSTDDLNKDNNSGVQLIDILQDAPQNQATATSVFKLMKEAFVDIRRNNGAYVISASQSNESALENNQVSNGVFTHAILDIMQHNPTINVNELNVLVNKKVTELTQGNQNTANRQELSDFNWILW
jgi:WD40 repeat protein